MGLIVSGLPPLTDSDHFHALFKLTARFGSYLLKARLHYSLSILGTSIEMSLVSAPATTCTAEASIELALPPVQQVSEKQLMS